jgi:hypothetical protein
MTLPVVLKGVTVDALTIRLAGARSATAPVVVVAVPGGCARR